MKVVEAGLAILFDWFSFQEPRRIILRIIDDMICKEDHQHVSSSVHLVLGSWHRRNGHVSLLQSGETALHVAARYGNVDVVQYLCSIHANPDLTDRVSLSRGWEGTFLELKLDSPLLM